MNEYILKIVKIQGYYDGAYDLKSAKNSYNTLLKKNQNNEN